MNRFGEEAHTAPAYQHNAEFSRVLEDRMAFYSTDQRADTINRVRGEISEVKTVMIENIDKVGLPLLLPAATICYLLLDWHSVGAVLGASGTCSSEWSLTLLRVLHVATCPVVPLAVLRLCTP